MKDKKIRKIANYIVELVKMENQKSEPSRPSLPKRLPFKEDHVVEYCNLDEKTSKKFVKFITSLLNQKSNLNLDINETYIILNCELPKNKPASAGRLNNERSVEIRIDENGFRFRKDLGTFYNFQDKTIFQILKPLLIQKNQELSNQFLDETIDELTVELNLSRENNLDEILS